MTIHLALDTDRSDIRFAAARLLLSRPKNNYSSIQFESADGWSSYRSGFPHLGQLPSVGLSQWNLISQVPVTKNRLQFGHWTFGIHIPQSRINTPV